MGAYGLHMVRPYGFHMGNDNVWIYGPHMAVQVWVPYGSPIWAHVGVPYGTQMAVHVLYKLPQKIKGTLFQNLSKIVK